MGISDLKLLGIALRARWPWLMKTDPNRPWASLPLHVSNEVECLLSLAVTSSVGNGKSTLFWKDNWLEGTSIKQIAPAIFSMIPKRRRNKRSVSEELTNGEWVQAIQSALSIRGEVSIEVVMEFMVLWTLIEEVELTEDEPDVHLWRLSSSGQYSAQTAYSALFEGAIRFHPYERIWKSWAPPKCKFFMWLVALDRCWTADRLAKRGLPHPAQCPLCEQCDETIQHLLVGCVLARQTWFCLFQMAGLGHLAPQPTEVSFDSWWTKVDDAVGGDRKKGINSLIILVCWSIWRHRNDCVFNNVTPSLAAVFAMVKDESHFWSMAGARGLDLVSATGIG